MEDGALITQSIRQRCGIAGCPGCSAKILLLRPKLNSFVVHAQKESLKLRATTIVLALAAPAALPTAKPFAPLARLSAQQNAAQVVRRSREMGFISKMSRDFTLTVLSSAKSATPRLSAPKG